VNGTAQADCDFQNFATIRHPFQEFKLQDKQADNLCTDFGRPVVGTRALLSVIDQLTLYKVRRQKGPSLIEIEIVGGFSHS
jgi:hypothetical protein